MRPNSLLDITNKKKKLLIEKIKRNKKLQKINKYKNKVILGVGIFGATTLLGPSSGPKKDYNLPNIKIEATINTISLDKYVVSAEEFYKKVKYNYFTKEWVYKKRSGEKFNVSDMISNEHLNKLNSNRINKNGVNFRFDDIPVSFKNDTIINIDTIFYTPKASLSCITKVDTILLYKNHNTGEKHETIKIDTTFMFPNTDMLQTKIDTIIKPRIFGKNKGSALTDSTMTKGYYYNANIVINRFVTDTTLTKEEQEKARARFKQRFKIDLDSLEQYDPKIEGGDPNKVYDHELGHSDSEKDGIKSYGLDVKHTYKLNIHNEIKSFIKQLLAQRDEYLRTGDIDCIKFAFYKNAIKSGKMNPTKNNISNDEKTFIAQETLKNWEKTLRETYRTQMKSLTKITLDNSIMEDTDKSEILYENILKRVYNIKTSNGERVNFFDFYKEPTLDEKDEKAIEELKKERGVNLGDKLAKIKKEYGKDVLNEYIRQEKQKLYEKEEREEREEREKKQRPVKPNSEAYIRDPKLVENEVFISAKKKARY